VTVLVKTALSEAVDEAASIPKPGLSARVSARPTGLCSRRIVVPAGSRPRGAAHWNLGVTPHGTSRSLALADARGCERMSHGRR
jgi:hypothetical protein